MQFRRSNTAIAPAQGPRPSSFQTEVERHEAKYLIPRALVSEIRSFIRPFCEPDKHGRGDPPEYVITTLQLDNLMLSLHRAKEEERLNRFKLRVRTYGDPPGEAPVFTEVKRKYGMVVNKSRSVIPYDQWCEDVVLKPGVNPQLRNPKHIEAFLEFKRLVRESASRPQVLIQYTRESYLGRFDQYARVTFDRRLRYQPATGWTGFGAGRRWRPMDSDAAQGMGFSYSAVILELKALADPPQWMIDLVMNFDLTRTGNCKYSTAVWMDHLGSVTDGCHPFAVDMDGL